MRHVERCLIIVRSLACYSLLPARRHPRDAAVPLIVKEVSEWSDRLDVMVVGPGLGKDPLMVRTVGSWLEHAASREKPAPVVLDGDGVHVLLEHPHLLQTRLVEHLVLTPNAAEFRRLWEKFVDKNPPPFDIDTDVQWLTDSQWRLPPFSE